MTRKIQVLIVEDNPADAELVLRELRRAEFDPQWNRVETEADYLNHLKPDLDLILSDFAMPEFSGLRALELAKEQGYGIPFIIISGTMGEDVAVEAIRQGATDYLLKDRTTRLGAAVNRALQEVKERTDRREVEGQLLWKTAFFEAQVNSALDGILIVDSVGKKVLQNQRMVDLWNLPQQVAGEVDDRKQLEWVTSQIKYPEQFAKQIAHLYAHPDEVSHDEIELIDRRFFERYSAPVRDRNGRHYGRIWAFRDITERKRADEQITEQAALLDKAQDAILVGDLDGHILFWNKGAERMYGWTKEEAAGRKRSELIYSDPALFKTIISQIAEKGELTGEIEHVTKDRRTLVVEARRSLIRDDVGNPKSELVIYTDITEKKKIEAQFMRAQRMESIGTLASGIAHDLNNILAPILLSIDVLKTMQDKPQAVSILETIELSAQRGADIVRQVLSFARGLEGHRVEVQPKHLLNDLKSIINDTFPKDIRLLFSIPNDIWTLLGDPTQVHQILLNLCVNARDAMPNGGNLTVSVENCLLDEQDAAMNIQAKAGQYVKISVTDSGIGMLPRLQERIFEPFFTTKELSKGTGLGLSTVLAIVKSHDGIVNVYSQPGKGTTFKIYLPAMESSPEVQAKLTKEAILPRGNGEMVLMVDDEASILVVSSETLQSFGYRVLTATDGADAVAKYAQHQDQIAVVLTDMAMPVMDGAATIYALMRINPSIKIISASGLDTDGGTSEAAQIGVKHFLLKPYTAATLLKTIRAILDDE